jgi:hypothetical protein
MIVWGGAGVGGTFLSSGARYNPSTDSWTKTNTAGAPAARTDATAVWTGTRMVVWGGFDGNGFVAVLRFLIKLNKLWQDFMDALNDLIGPILAAKFIVPISLLALGLSAWLMFRQLGFSPAVCLLGGLAAALARPVLALVLAVFVRLAYF